MTTTDTHARATTYAKDDAETVTALRVLLSVTVFVTGWATSVALWGIPGLYIPALALVPVMWALLLIISRG